MRGVEFHHSAHKISKTLKQILTLRKFPSQIPSVYLAVRGVQSEMKEKEIISIYNHLPTYIIRKYVYKNFIEVEFDNKFVWLLEIVQCQYIIFFYTYLKKESFFLSLV